jgi:hypothetical protein
MEMYKACPDVETAAKFLNIMESNALAKTIAEKFIFDNITLHKCIQIKRDPD